MPGGRFAYDVDNLLEKQKIVFIMPVSSYSEPYVEGYFIDTKGKKHIYGLYGQAPFESIEMERVMSRRRRKRCLGMGLQRIMLSI